MFKKKKKLRGQNKSRPTYQRDSAKEFCMRVLDNRDQNNSQKCAKEGCKFLHNLEEYLKNKPKDIGSTCYNYIVSGKCLRGVTCRFATAHLNSTGINIVDEEKFKRYLENGPHIKNNISRDLQNKLWKKTYNFGLAEKIIQYCDGIMKNKVSIYFEFLFGTFSILTNKLNLFLNGKLIFKRTVIFIVFSEPNYFTSQYSIKEIFISVSYFYI